MQYRVRNVPFIQLDSEARIAFEGLSRPVGARRNYLTSTRGSASLHPWLAYLAPLGQLRSAESDGKGRMR
jgi:hypothetical protein